MAASKFDFVLSDKRIMEQRLRKHQLSQQEYQKFLKTLVDEKEHGEEFQVLSELGLVKSGEKPQA